MTGTDGSSCPLCGAHVAATAHFCSACGELIRRPPVGAPLAPVWRGVLAARDADDRDTVFGAPAVVLPDDPDEPAEPAAPSVTAPRPEQPSAMFEHVSLDPPEGFRETAWFRDGDDAEAMSAVEHDDVPHDDRARRYRADRAVVDEADRRRWSLSEDDRGE